MTEPTVLFEIRGAVALITLNRPQSLNSLNRQLQSELSAAYDRIEADPGIRAAVITGAGRAFSAGGDLAEFDLAPGPNLIERADPGPLIHEAFNPVARQLASLRVPTVAAVNGVAAGAGVSLALGCDMVIASPQASFIQAFSKIGLAPDAGGTYYLPRKLGLARALGCALLGDKLSAADAKAWGMIWDVAPEGQDCVEVALALATRLAAMPTRALVEIRHLLRAAGNNDLDAQLDLERDRQSALGRTHDYIEGVTAFLEKRPARFKGE
ncbi:MAG: enoyl-CoA hydratase-related protein [Pseudomonadota bacterium]